MAILTVTPVTRAGIDIAGAAADVAGDSFPNTGHEYLVVKNGSGAPITVTLDIKQTVDGQAVTDPTVTIAAGASKIIGPFPTGIYNDTNGRAGVTYSAVTTVNVIALAAS
jgi:hypothetical protein